MVNTTPLWYRAGLRAALPLVPLVFRDPRQREAHRARLGATERLARWGEAGRDPARPLAWFHAPSVGEGLQARAVIEALRAQRPDVQLLYTHFSPSATTFAATVPADFRDYLPYDRPMDVERLLTAIKPDVLIFTKLDLWPELAVRAAAHGVKVAMVAATVSPESSRLRWPARSATRAGYASLALAGAISSDDAARLTRLGCPADRIIITGDPRVDSVLGIVDAMPADDPLRLLGDPGSTMVAGSTWPDDEQVLLAAFATVRAKRGNARLILVPHDPTPAHLDGITAAAAAAGLDAPVRLSTMEAGSKPSLLLIDKLGVLARLYAAGGMAYVGGGFGRAGIHSVLEPAAWGRPVIIGPRDRGSRDAQLLADGGGLVRLSRRTPVPALTAQWLAWLEHPAARTQAGQAARAALNSERGAAWRNAEMVATMLDDRGRMTDD
jgi:3-deoxy-D-manno-octulosonic-acid transferase